MTTVPPTCSFRWASRSPAGNVNGSHIISSTPAAGGGPRPEGSRRLRGGGGPGLIRVRGQRKGCSRLHEPRFPGIRAPGRSVAFRGSSDPGQHLGPRLLPVAATSTAAAIRVVTCGGGGEVLGPQDATPWRSCCSGDDKNEGGPCRSGWVPAWATQ